MIFKSYFKELGKIICLPVYQKQLLVKFFFLFPPCMYAYKYTGNMELNPM